MMKRRIVPGLSSSQGPEIASIRTLPCMLNLAALFGVLGIYASSVIAGQNKQTKQKKTQRSVYALILEPNMYKVDRTTNVMVIQTVHKVAI